MELSVCTPPQCPALAIREPAPYAGAVEGEYCVSAVSPELKAKRDQIIATEGFWSVDRVRTFLERNSGKDFEEENETKTRLLDVNMAVAIDLYTDEPTFIVPAGTAYSRAQLMEAYPFEYLGQLPEEIFTQQYIAVFGKGYLDTMRPEDCVLYDSDRGDEEVLTTVNLISSKVNPKRAQETKKLVRSVKTKVFIARESWDDFTLLVRGARAQMRLLANARRRGEMPPGLPSYRQQALGGDAATRLGDAATRLGDAPN